MSKKQIREDLERDPLLETFSKAQSFYDNNKTTVIGGVLAVVLAIGGLVGYYYYSENQEEKAQQLMADASTYYMNGDYEKALRGSDTDFTVGFEQIINNYSGTEAGNLAHYYASVSEYNLGNVEQAISYIEEYEVPEGILGVGPISFQAVLMTDAGNHQKAAELYVKAAEWDKNDSTTPYNYLEAANAYYDAGNNEEARKYAQLVVEQYSNSSQVAAAQRLLGTLAVAAE
ncbi:tetratricopeptide repeat protein [Fodinibius sediminis]|uniref:Negative regulator of RcsB-dependent stress response n=1 Tax=Fodinibius sediminis TaxID=1214077 RepID=A0A521CRV3_9BACT|nr:tetratricopeptide repeat protein [Fodinibius sediminis]SMO62183.1 Putative negative regulator of RcsB-dependent stress response [Fodinibius sediminis]